jgi:hypothetical protein
VRALDSAPIDRMVIEEWKLCRPDAMGQQNRYAFAYGSAVRLSSVNSASTWSAQT